MGFKDTIANFFRVQDTDENYEVEEYVETKPARAGAPSRGREMAKINIIEPRVYSEVETIAERLIQKQAVLLNLRRVDEAQARRIIDYLAGIVYAVKGDVEKLSEDIFLCVPENFEIEGILNEENNNRLDFTDSI